MAVAGYNGEHMGSFEGRKGARAWMSSAVTCPHIMAVYFSVVYYFPLKPFQLLSICICICFVKLDYCCLERFINTEGNNEVASISGRKYV